MPLCSACNAELHRRKFSQTQLGKDPRRCIGCVSANHKIRDDAPTNNRASLQDVKQGGSLHGEDDAALATEAPSFEALAPELLQMIAQHADFRATTALASTCTSMRPLFVQQLKALNTAMTLLTIAPFRNRSEIDRYALAGAVQTMRTLGYTLAEIKKLRVSNDVLRSAGFVFPTDFHYRHDRALCPECWGSDFGHYLDDESIMGLGREWSVFCRACRWSVHGV